MLGPEPLQEEAIKAAKASWVGKFGEQDNPYLKRQYGSENPIESPEFAQLALELWQPLLDHLEGS